MQIIFDLHILLEICDEVLSYVNTSSWLLARHTVFKMKVVLTLD